MNINPEEHDPQSRLIGLFKHVSHPTIPPFAVSPQGIHVLLVVLVKLVFEQSFLHL